MIDRYSIARDELLRATESALREVAKSADIVTLDVDNDAALRKMAAIVTAKIWRGLGGK